MAHRMNIVQVLQDFAKKESDQVVTDPVCKAELARRNVKHMLFYNEAEFYFCSKSCQNKYKNMKNLPKAS